MQYLPEIIDYPLDKPIFMLAFRGSNEFSGRERKTSTIIVQAPSADKYESSVYYLRTF